MARFVPQADRFLFIDLAEHGASFRDRLESVFGFDPRRGGPARHPRRGERPAAPARRDKWREAARRMVAEHGARADALKLARLWTRAGEREKAVDAATRAAQAALRDGAPAQAAEAFALAVGQLDAADQRRAALELRHAEALSAAGELHAAARVLEAAARGTRDRIERARLSCRLAEAHCESGRFSAAVDSAREALELVGVARDRELRVRALCLAAVGTGRGGDPEAALAEAEAARAAVRPGDAVPVRIDVHRTAGLLLLRLGRPAARRDLEQAVELARGAGLSARGLPALAGLALLEARAGDWPRAELRLRDVQRAAGDQRRYRLLEATLSRLATAAVRQDRLDLALELGRQALQEARRLGDADLLLAAQSRLAETFQRCGRPSGAVSLLREALRDRLDATSSTLTDVARVLLAGALLEESSEQAGTSRLLLEQAMPGLRRQQEDLRVLALVTELERAALREDTDCFEPALIELDALRRQATLDPELVVRAELARAELALRRGDTATALEACRAGLAGGEGSGSALQRAAVPAMLGRALAVGGDAADAEAAARQAREALEQGCARVADPEVVRDLRTRAAYRIAVPAPPVAAGADRRLSTLYEMIRAINSEPDLDALLESILDMALRAVGAERGMILLKGEGADAEEFAVRLARNLDEQTARDAEGYSRNIIREAGGGRSLLVLDARDDERFRDLASVSLYGIRSLLCVPLRAGETIIGTVYLDNRSEGALFSQADLRFLEAFADHAAVALRNARRREALSRENRVLQSAARARVRFAGLVGRSAPMQRVYDLIDTFSTSDLPVLIRGDSGTGKELVARAIQLNGARRRAVFLSENCASIADSLLESELFGHVKGAFTGADRDRGGLFEQADGGTLFLDEVGDMSPAMQAKLLRALQEGEVRRVGASAPLHVNVRVLAATHRNLEAEVGAGRFREDLYYRLSVLTVELPPLRERPGDVRLLTEFFLDRIARERGRPVPALDRAVQDALERYGWPGNVRQLENALQRMALLAGDGPITPAVVRSDAGLRRQLLPGDPQVAAAESLAASERGRIEEALRAAAGNRDRAAGMLGISRATIYRKIKQYGLG